MEVSLDQRFGQQSVSARQDGGNILKIGSKVVVGWSNETNLEGIEQLKRIISPYGYQTIPVPITKV